MKKKILTATLGAGIGLLVLFVCGPSAIQAVYSNSTPDATIEQLKMRYNSLADRETSLPQSGRKLSGNQRAAIWYWLHMRGFGIDEGDAEEIDEAFFPVAVYHHTSFQWSNMWHYWLSPKESKDAALLLADQNGGPGVSKP